MNEAAYNIVKADMTRVWLIDLDLPNRSSVTDDAERVCIRVNELHPGKRILYRDTDGNWDELVHERGAFKQFRSARQEGLAP